MGFFAQKYAFTASDASRILETNPFPSLCISEDLEILFCNSALIELFNIPEQAISSLRVFDLMPEFQPNGLTSKSIFTNYLRSAREKGSLQSSWAFITSQDTNFITKITISPANKEDGSHFFVYIHYESPCKNCINEAQKTQQFITSILDTVPMTMHIWSRDLQLIDCSSAVQHMFGVKSKDDYKRNFSNFSPEYQVDGLSKELVPEYLEKAFTDGIYKFQWLSQDATGRIFPTEETLCRVDFLGEQLVIGYTQDISTITEGIRNIIHMEERTRAILDATPMAILLWDSSFIIKDTNLEALRIYGFDDKQELLTEFDKVMPDTQPDGTPSTAILQNALSIAFEKGYHHIPKLYCQDKDGMPLPVEMTTIRVIIRDETMAIAYLRDLREILQVLDTMKAHEERIQAILDSTPMAIHLWNAKHRVIDTNLESLQLFGYDNKLSLLQEIPKLAPKYQPDGKRTAQIMRKAIEVAFKTGYYHLPQVMCLTKDMQPLPVEITLIRITSRDEPIVIAYLHDLREILQVLDRMKENEERVQSILDEAPMAIKIWDEQLERSDTNLEYLRLFGYNDKSELHDDRERTLPKFQPSGTSSLELIQGKILSAFTSGYERFDMLARHTDGSPVPVEVTLVRMQLHGNSMVVGYVRDLREITEFISKIKESEERTQAILDLSPLGINVWDTNVNLVDCNKAIVRLYGFNSQKEYIENRHRVLPEKQPDGQESVASVTHKIQQAFAMGQSTAEAMSLDIHGNTIPVDVVYKRANLAGNDVVIEYLRDLREFKAMLAEIHAVEQDLRSARDVAVQSASAKSEFLANMSHEIRTPLNGVLGLLHLLDNTPLQDVQKDYVNKTIFSAENLLRIINDILDFSKIDAGKMEMENIPFALEDVASELKLLFEPQANSRNLALTFKYDTCIKRILLGDPLRIKQVFFNLIGNAIKFTEEGGVTINMTGKEETPGSMHCLFSVKDSGIGMNDEQRSRLFSAFMQADTSVTRKYGGTGLGLVIARRIANLMQGDLWVESVEGEGSTFFFSAVFEFASPDAQFLPIFDSHMESEAFNASQQDESSPQEPAAVTLSQAEALALANPNSTQAQHRRVHILLIEDNEINQLIAEELLKNVGHTVDIANNGQEGLDLLEKNVYHIVLSDIQMPVMDGLTVVTKIRQDTRLAHMPVIAMSAHAMTGDKEISLHHGMNEHITKPISPEILYDVVNTWALQDNELPKPAKVTK